MNTRIVHIIDTTDTGFFAEPAGPSPSDGLAIFRVRWNRKGTARYAEELMPPVDGPRGRTVRFAYRGQAPLRALTTADALPPARLLRHLAERAPYDTCLFCHRPVDDDVTSTFGMGVHCAAKHLGVTARFLAVVHARLSPPPDGGQPGPAGIRRGHLRLVAAYGRLIEAA